MYDNILNRQLRFIGNVSERARNLIEQVIDDRTKKTTNEEIIFNCLVIEKNSQ